MRSAEAIAKRSAAPLTVLHVSPQLEPVVGVVHDHEWCSYLANVLRAEIGKLKREAGIEAAVRLAAGEPARTVAEMTSELKADLLVIGRPRPRGLLGRLRTHSYAIMSEAPCPVLSV
jgi:nucleotide-binding universal stress UspA family protein